MIDFFRQSLIVNEKWDFQVQSGFNFIEIKTGRQTGGFGSINLDLISVRLKLEDKQVGCVGTNRQY